MAFFLYKGLKKPLIFFGLKDKYIFYAMGSVVTGFMLVAILSSFIGTWGLVVGAGIGGLGVWMSFKTQDTKGLYNKTKNTNELHIIPVKFKNTKLFHKIKSRHDESKEKNI